MEFNNVNAGSTIRRALKAAEYRDKFAHFNERLTCALHAPDHHLLRLAATRARSPAPLRERRQAQVDLTLREVCKRSEELSAAPSAAQAQRADLGASPAAPPAAPSPVSSHRGAVPRR